MIQPARSSIPPMTPGLWMIRKSQNAAANITASKRMATRLPARPLAPACWATGAGMSPPADVARRLLRINSWMERTCQSVLPIKKSNKGSANRARLLETRLRHRRLGRSKASSQTHSRPAIRLKSCTRRRLLRMENSSSAPRLEKMGFASMGAMKIWASPCRPTYCQPFVWAFSTRVSDFLISPSFFPGEHRITRYCTGSSPASHWSRPPTWAWISRFPCRPCRFSMASPAL